MTAPAITAPQLILARNAADAALAVLPTSRALVAGEPMTPDGTTAIEGQAVTARFSGPATGEVVVVVGQDLADALKESPLGELDLTAAVRPALEAAARVFGPVVLDPGQVMEPQVALSALAAKEGAVAIPLRDDEDIRAMLALSLSPWPDDDPLVAAATGGGVAQRAPEAPAVGRRGGLDMLHDVEMEVSAELGRTRMSVRELLSLTPGAIVELDRAAGSPADLLVNGRLIARGEVVVVDENFGIRITEIVSPGAE
ncbi:flagellar motor switch protein FliN [Actinoplanes sp. SE50]|uniref:flagellar motor switch protein FliN n=1 Tax=unclassified Actinoplanes TaxID=2626549 RepID=UPI00023EDEF7|nr:MULTISPECIES: flagellar motor switch protein FliN [unclassified Actinoplanes]AEV88798.1 Flagellar motor switch protein fliM [Actinoplanes sp. SE50/110]ATO87204.1 flagellar motor switch protein FliN [Actinoplanes sp. SE50]SLM04622.1 Flagellar motor switch protein fliN [Actinoplanes sp. SE50/110]